MHVSIVKSALLVRKNQEKLYNVKYVIVGCMLSVNISKIRFKLLNQVINVFLNLAQNRKLSHYYTRLNQLSTGTNIDQAGGISQSPQSLLEQHNTLKKSVIQLDSQIEDPCQNNFAIKINLLTLRFLITSMKPRKLCPGLKIKL